MKKNIFSVFLCSMFQVVLVGVYQLNAGDDVPSSPTNVMDAQSAYNHENKKSQNSQDDGGDQNSIVNMQGTAAAVNAKGQSAVYDGSKITVIDQQKADEAQQKAAADAVKAEKEQFMTEYNSFVDSINERHTIGMESMFTAIEDHMASVHSYNENYSSQYGGTKLLVSGQPENDALRNALKDAIGCVSSSVSAKALVSACAGATNSGAHSELVLNESHSEYGTVSEMISKLEALENVTNYDPDEHQKIVKALKDTLTNYYNNNNSQGSLSSCVNDVYFDHAAFQEAYEKYSENMETHLEYAHEITEHHQTALKAAKARQYIKSLNI